jgi:hypothetical protein
LADGFVALNLGEPDQVEWLVEQLTADNMRERLVVQLIERGLSLEPTLKAVVRSRTHFDSVQVFEALVQRASQEAAQADAKADLDAAQSWSPPKSNADSDGCASLEAVAERFPALRAEAAGLIPALSEGA